ncbi:MAG: hypothetical protein QXS81_01245 [Candidatus Micrarchaeaceae archaeon]
MNNLYLKLYDIYDTMQHGWDRTAFLFYISTPAALVAHFFGIAGVLSIALTALFLYAAGKFHRHLAAAAQPKASLP